MQENGCQRQKIQTFDLEMQERVVLIAFSSKSGQTTPW